MNTDMNPNNAAAASAKKPADVDHIISRILRIGVLTSAAIIIFGLVLLFVRGNGGYPDDTFPTRLPDMLRGFGSFKPNAVILIGLLCLILTPVMRVFVSIFAFLLEKDYLYVLISGTVFVILILSMVLGIHG
jgi:uncharacterized membrane protein